VDRALEAAVLYVPGVVAVVFVGIAYFFVALDRLRTTSASADDDQLGIKLVLYALVLAGVQLAAGGADGMLAYVLGGFKGGSGPLRDALPPIIVGLGSAFAIAKLLLPRTNAHFAKRPERLALGALATLHGAIALVGLSGFVTGIFKSWAWSMTSASMATTIVSGAIAYLAISRLGAHSGWTMPPPRPRTDAPPYQQPPGGYPPAPPGGYR
jgi:hypothetical protein